MHGENKPREISRRDMLKKGGLVVGAAVWMTPAIQVLNMTPAAANGNGSSEPSSGSAFGSDIEGYSDSDQSYVGTDPRKRERKGGGPVEDRNIPAPPDPRDD